MILSRPAGQFNIKYCRRCNVYTAQDVTYAPDLTLPATKLRELNARGTGPCRPSATSGPTEAIKRDWEEGRHRRYEQRCDH